MKSLLLIQLIAIITVSSDCPGKSEGFNLTSMGVKVTKLAWELKCDFRHLLQAVIVLFSQWVGKTMLIRVLLFYGS